MRTIRRALPVTHALRGMKFAVRVHAARAADMARMAHRTSALTFLRSDDAMKTFHCNRCDNLVFFENIQCERCGALLGYVPELGEISAFEPAPVEAANSVNSANDANHAADASNNAPPDSPPAVANNADETTAEATPDTSSPPLSPPTPRWTSLHPDAPAAAYRQCHNYAVENVCNWMIPADDDATLCRACQLTRTIPNLDASDESGNDAGKDLGKNRLYWYRLETAKRRLLYTLFALGLPVESRAEDPEHGLQFDFLENTPDGEHVMTGHADGVVTLNVAEADDAQREKTRSELGEPYRTLLGHFRHEVGHYYFDRLIAGTRWLEPFRRQFGDERADYGEALARHYETGAPPDWALQYVSAYATMHPWEDWAETWAHYLHMVDTLDTAASCGLALVPETPHEPTLTDQTPVEEASFDNLMKRWFPLTYVLNSLNRSLGMQDGYPFTLAPPVIDKLRFVHRVLTHAGAKR